MKILSVLIALPLVLLLSFTVRYFSKLGQEKMVNAEIRVHKVSFVSSGLLLYKHKANNGSLGR